MKAAQPTKLSRLFWFPLRTNWVGKHPATGFTPHHALTAVKSSKSRFAGHTGTICSLDNLCGRTTPSGPARLPWPLRTRDPKASCFPHPAALISGREEMSLVDKPASRERLHGSIARRLEPVGRMPPWPERTIDRPRPRPGQQHDASNSLSVGGHLVIVGVTCRLQHQVCHRSDSRKGPDELTDAAGALTPVRVTWSGQARSLPLFSVRRGFRVPGTVHFSAHPLRNIWSLSTGLR